MNTGAATVNRGEIVSMYAGLYAFTVLGAFIMSAPFTVILSALLLPMIVCIGFAWLCVDLARAEQSKCHTHGLRVVVDLTCRVFLPWQATC